MTGRFPRLQRKWCRLRHGATGERLNYPIRKAAEQQRAYIDFILDLYHAQPLHGYAWLHGTKGGRLVHVGGVEALVSVGAVRQMALEFKKAMGSGPNTPTTNGLDVLGWDFAFEISEVAKQQAQAANVRMTLMRIPRDMAEVRSAVTHWSQWIDYWAVDWYHCGDTFHNEWQTFRTRKDPKPALSAVHAYAEPGEYQVVVKVIDILGNDTTKTVTVGVK
jgi:hypothetical protein